MDIGTAKPSAAERAAVPHHLIDIASTRRRPTRRRAVRGRRHPAGGEIRRRGRLPLLVGGTMLYFKALREGLDAMPPADPRCAPLDARPPPRRLAGAARRAGARGPGHRGALPPGDASASSARWRSGAQRPAAVGLHAQPRSGRPAACRCWRWSRPSAPGCTSASPSASTPCWRPAWSTRCGAARARRPARRPAVDALRGLPPGLGGAGPAAMHPRRRLRSCASAASPPRASWPSAS
jgi:hypothetical protein